MCPNLSHRESFGPPGSMCRGRNALQSLTIAAPPHDGPPFHVEAHMIQPADATLRKAARLAFAIEP
eukprot:7109641-Prymnesium_polylepis.2